MVLFGKCQWDPIHYRQAWILFHAIAEQSKAEGKGKKMKKRKKREKTIYVDELFEHFFSLGYTLRIY